MHRYGYLTVVGCELVRCRRSCLSHHDLCFLLSKLAFLPSVVSNNSFTVDTLKPLQQHTFDSSCRSQLCCVYACLRVCVMLTDVCCIPWYVLCYDDRREVENLPSLKGCKAVLRQAGGKVIILWIRLHYHFLKEACLSYFLQYTCGVQAEYMRITIHVHTTCFRTRPHHVCGSSLKASS